ncbi:hypothetical protein I540_3416 [Mycobacteroides abscessus subsp. bolletii 1513]|uniref:TetR family transcriptional regulator n=1 Tax=Mycobacteroides abscessus subsp. bolletii 1513 TaxID=1299321 RepID=X8DUN5_9MYCO|nr:hypothetical protein I540_3416 [Mycobacteroides abscessus subsp. bolletii 1513]
MTRWLATYGFHRRALAVAGPRIAAYLQRQGGGVVDEPATAQALATGILRGLDCGAYTDSALPPGCDRAVLDQLVQRNTVDAATGGTDQR